MVAVSFLCRLLQTPCAKTKQFFRKLMSSSRSCHTPRLSLRLRLFLLSLLRLLLLLFVLFLILPLQTFNLLLRLGHGLEEPL